ncbi:MAG: tetratricopeptide repeat protein [bacterium]|nr:tetratricopeptide repeat protein [bacterium]
MLDTDTTDEATRNLCEHFLDIARRAKKLGNFTIARRALDAVLTRNPTHVYGRILMADLHLQTGDRDAAIAGYLEVAHYYCEHGFYLKGLALYKHSLTLDPQNTTTWKTVANLSRQLGLSPNAIIEYRTLAEHHHAAGEIEQYLAVLDTMLEMDPTNAWALAERDQMRTQHPSPPAALTGCSDGFSNAERALGHHLAPLLIRDDRTKE